MKTIITIVLLLCIIGVRAQITKRNISIYSTTRSVAYMDADSCWHITDTIGTLNALVKANDDIHKYYQQRIEKENKKLIAANNILKQVRITGQIDNKRKFLKSVIAYYKTLGVKPLPTKYRKPNYLKAI